MAKRKTSPSLNPDIIRVGGLVCISFLGFALLVMGAAAFLKSSSHFVVRDISLAESLQSLEIPELLKLKGQNIFDVDLARIEARIRSKYPQLSDLRVMRHFPDQVFVTAVRRVPFAYAAFENRLCVIDSHGIMMGPPVREQAPLPVIKGLKTQRMLPGDVVGDVNVRAGLEIVELFHQGGKLPGLELEAVRVDDPTRIVCDIEKDGAEFQIIMDKEHIAQRLRTFADVLARGGVDMNLVKYIDLRFGEPVIGQKKVKK